MSKLNSIESQLPKEKWLFALIWAGADVFGLFSNNVGPFSRNLVPNGCRILI